MRCSRLPCFLCPRLATWRLALAAALVLVITLAGRTQVPDPSTKDAAAPTEAERLDHQILGAARTGSEIMANLTYLSDIIGPRVTGSAALKRANEWTALKMKSYGLTDVRLEGWTIPLGWERGPASVRLLEPDHAYSLAVAALGWTPGTKGKIQGDVFVLTAKNSAELKAYRGKLKDAIVLRGAPATVRPITDTAYSPARSGSPSGRSGTPPGPNQPAQKADGDSARPEAPPALNARSERRGYTEMMEFRRELTEFLRAEGAAVLLSDAAKPHGLLVTTGGWSGRDRASAGDPLPALYVAHEHYALLHRLATRPTPARTHVEVEIQNKLIPGPIAVYNTVGEIRGSEKPDEFVILAAHLDSWDLAQGTTDNGTGSTVVLEAARILARCGVRPKRTIRFVLFTGEEQGLHGSRAYVEKHKDELARTSLCLVHDTGTGRVTGIGLQGRAAIKPVLEAELASLKAIGVTDVNLRSMGGSDHASFERAGVPGFAVQQDMAEYRFTHHSQSDTLDKAREPDLIQGAQVMAVSAMRVANLDQLLPRDRQTDKASR